MNIQNQSNINFTSRISEQVMHKINVEKRCCDTPVKTSKIVKNKIENIQKWGSPETELVITKNLQGKNCLGLKLKINQFITGIWEIKNLSGRKILTNILNLHESHIISTEKSIKFLYNKYGSEVFSKVK